MHLIVGRIIRPHGIRGEVIVDVRTDDPQDRFVPGTALVTSTSPDAPGTAELIIEEVRAHQGRLIVAFDGVPDRDAAEQLRGLILWADTTGLGPLPDPDEFRDHELVGLAAVTPDGQRLGEVARIDHAPASDLLVLRRVGGGTALVPFVKAIVPEVDLARGRVIIDPPGGLLDL